MAAALTQASGQLLYFLFVLSGALPFVHRTGKRTLREGLIVIAQTNSAAGSDGDRIQLDGGFQGFGLKGAVYPKVHCIVQ